MFEDGRSPDRRDGTGADGPGPARLEALEKRLLLSAVYPTVYEQYLLELINRARSDPAAEAARYGIDLNEGITSGLITTTSKQPLAMSPYLVDSSRGHSQWLLDNDEWGHTGAGGSSPGDRMAAAGYGTLGTFGWGENIAYSTSFAYPELTSKTEHIHELLFVDAGYDGRGHRKAICGDDYREGGMGVLVDEYEGWTYTTMVTEDFAYKLTNHFLTGVAFDESLVTGDEGAGVFYHPGEQLSGATVTATRDSDQAVFTTTTWASGGYSLQVPDGTYTVTGSGGGLGGTVTYTAVVVGGQNVKRDFNPAPAELQLTTPAGGEQASGGGAYNVMWSGGSGTTTLNLWRFGPPGLARLAEGLDAANASYAWSTAGAADGLYTFAAQVRYDGVWADAPVSSPGWVEVVQVAAPAALPPVLSEGVLSSAASPEADPSLPGLSAAPGPARRPPADPPAKRLALSGDGASRSFPAARPGEGADPAAGAHTAGLPDEAAADGGDQTDEGWAFLLSPDALDPLADVAGPARLAAVAPAG